MHWEGVFGCAIPHLFNPDLDLAKSQAVQTYLEDAKIATIFLKNRADLLNQSYVADSVADLEKTVRSHEKAHQVRNFLFIQKVRDKKAIKLFEIFKWCNIISEFYQRD